MIQNDITQIKVEIGEITILTLCGKTDLNILNADTIAELSNKLDVLAEDPQIKVLIITGNGNKAFCSGADINELANMDPDLVDDYVISSTQTYQKIQDFPVPVIGVINGLAYGAAFELLLSCDIRFMAEETKIGQPAVMHGLVPPFGGTYRLPKIVGIGKAKEIIFSAAELDAKYSQKIGLVNRVYPQKELLEHAIVYAKKICKNKRYAVSMSKKLINQRIYDMVDYNSEDTALIECLKNQETKKQLLSFFERNRNKR